MSQAFSLYSELTVQQNLVLHARLFHVPSDEIAGRIDRMAVRFGLTDVMDALPELLPLGQRQRLSLAVALIHHPELLITSGVDPIARDGFWRHLIDLSRNDGVTIFISTHFINEAARCDRISLMHAGRVLVSDTPAGLVKRRGAKTLDDAFLEYLEEAVAKGEKEQSSVTKEAVPIPPTGRAQTDSINRAAKKRFSPRRMLSYTWREVLELTLWLTESGRSLRKIGRTPAE